MQVSLENINPDNWRIFNSLKVKAEQEKYVAANVNNIKEKVLGSLPYSNGLG